MKRGDILIGGHCTARTKDRVVLVDALVCTVFAKCADAVRFHQPEATNLPAATERFPPLSLVSSVSYASQCRVYCPFVPVHNITRIHSSDVRGGGIAACISYHQHHWLR